MKWFLVSFLLCLNFSTLASFHFINCDFDYGFSTQFKYPRPEYRGLLEDALTEIQYIYPEVLKVGTVPQSVTRKNLQTIQNLILNPRQVKVECVRLIKNDPRVRARAFASEKRIEIAAYGLENDSFCFIVEHVFHELAHLAGFPIISAHNKTKTVKALREAWESIKHVPTQKVLVDSVYHVGLRARLICEKEISPKG